MGFVKELKSGEELTKPKATIPWMAAAIVLVVLLGFVVMAALWILGKGANAVQNVPVLGTVTAPARVYAS